MGIIGNIFYVLIIAVTGVIVWITLSLNTKSDGIGAAITGASDNYRGAVGVEEQKRNLLRTFCYSFMGLCLLYTILETYL